MSAAPTPPVSGLAILVGFVVQTVIILAAIHLAMTADPLGQLLIAGVAALLSLLSPLLIVSLCDE